MSILTRSIGAPVDRIEGRDKVIGEATYAFEYEQENVAYGAIVQSTIAKGRVKGIDPADALVLGDVEVAVDGGRGRQRQEHEQYGLERGRRGRLGGHGGPSPVEAGRPAPRSLLKKG